MGERDTMSEGSENLPERFMLGTYEIRDELGRGGMGQVFLALDPALERFVAIKTLRPELRSEPTIASRFVQEARSVARLRHPSIVQVFAADTAANNPYIVMEYVQGASLEDVIKREGPIPWQRALTICGQTASALATAHKEGIIHRDIKPANILIDMEGRARVTDFGIAKVLDNTGETTAQYVSIGSPSYMAPEQWQSGGTVPATDLFALGVTTYQMLTGELPFKATAPAELLAEISQKPLPSVRDKAPDLPPVVEAFIGALAAKNLDERYATAQEVVDDLSAMREGKAPPHLPRICGANVGAVTEIESAQNSPPLPSLVDELLEQREPVYVPPHPRVQREIPWALLGLGAALLIIGAMAAMLTMGGGQQQQAAEPLVQPGPPPPQNQNSPPQFGGPGQHPPPPPGATGQNPPSGAIGQNPPPPGAAGQNPPPRLGPGQGGQGQHPPSPTTRRTTREDAAQANNPPPQGGTSPRGTR